MSSWRSWFARSTEATSRGLPHEDAPVAEILGVTDDPRHNVGSGGTGLYEFWTVDGVPVSLHDMTLIGVRWEPVRRRLGLRFAAELDVVMDFANVVRRKLSVGGEVVRRTR